MDEKVDEGEEKMVKEEETDGGKENTGGREVEERSSGGCAMVKSTGFGHSACVTSSKLVHHFELASVF